jgi:hypothetical protein
MQWVAPGGFVVCWTHVLEELFSISSLEGIGSPFLHAFRIYWFFAMAVFILEFNSLPTKSLLLSCETPQEASKQIFNTLGSTNARTSSSS